MKSPYLLAIVAILTTLVAPPQTAYALRIIPHFTAGVLVCTDSNATSCQPVICSNNPNNPTPTPTGPNVLNPTGFTTSCMTPQERSSVYSAINNIEKIVADPITVNLEYYDESDIVNSFNNLKEVLITSVNSNNPGAAYDNVVNRLKQKNFVNRLLGLAIKGPFSANAIQHLPSYADINVIYPNEYQHCILGDYIDNTPSTNEYYATTCSALTTDSMTNITKPLGVHLTVVNYRLLTLDGLLPIPDVKVQVFNQGLAQTIPTVDAVIINGVSASGLPVFYNQNDPAILAQQPLWNNIVTAGDVEAGIISVLNGNLNLTGIFPSYWNPGTDETAIMMHETVHALGFSVKATASQGGLYLPPELAGNFLALESSLSIPEMLSFGKTDAGNIISVANYIHTSRLDQYSNRPTNTGISADRHVFVYHISTGPGDSTKYIGAGSHGTDFEDFDHSVIPITISAANNIQVSSDSPAFYDQSGNLLDSPQTTFSGLFGLEGKLSIREAIMLQSLGFGIVNLGSVVDGNLGK